LLVRLGDGQLAESSGQLQFDFAGEPPSSTVSVASGRETAENLFERGLTHEEVGDLAEAAQAYRQALLVGGPDDDTSFNLANVLFALGEKEMAAERFRQVVEMNPGFAEAWNNLGNVLADLNLRDEAHEAFQKALELDPSFADAHYNLADLLDQLGRLREAKIHWQSYLRLGPAQGPWTDYAQQRLAAIELARLARP
jgi:tetratricopeptide (TPR) repeat protein